MSTINIGDITNAKFKVGGADCSIYLGDVKLYPQSTVSPKLTLYYDGGTVETLNCGDNTYIESGDTSQMTSGYTSAVVGDCVTYIGPKAFANFKSSVSNNSSLTSVTLSEGITQLNGCFTRCTNLSAVTIPNSVTYIGSSTFRNCYKLQSIYIPSGVTAINTQTFYYCSGMTSVNIPSGVTTIGENAFGYCENLLNVVIPDSVTTIKKNAFFDCLSFTSVNIPDSVVSIGDGAFNEGRCTSITIGSGVTSMGLRAFRNQTNLTSITIKATTPPSLGGNDVFDDTNNCPIYVPSESLEAYKAATNWSEYADRFVAIQSSTCYEIISEPITSYTSTTYDSVYSTADGKWYMLNNLNQYEEYGIYDVVEDITSATTYEGKLGVVGETEYQYSGGSWSVVGSYVDSSVTYTIDNTSPSPYVGEELSTTFKIPCADVEAIEFADFRISDNNAGYLSLMLDTSGWEEYHYEGSDYYQGTVTNDGEYFYLSLPSEAPQSIIIERIDYWNSTPIHIIVGSKQATVEYVEKAVPSVTVYANVTELEAATCPTVGVGEYGFVGSDLYKYFTNEEWSGVTYYEPKMFAFDGEGNPMVVYKNGNTVLSQDEIKIKGASLVSVYIGDSVTEIDSNAFSDENLITAVTFSENSQLTSIGGDAFYQCSSITSVTIPNSVTSIGSYAFDYCSKLTSISIPSGITNIGGFAFSNTPWWNTYSADTSHQYGNIVYINDVAYYRTSSAITSCNFREGTVGIGGGAFQSCRSLTSINIPDSVTSIEKSAFAYCSGLTSVTIGSGVTEIGDNVFVGCRSLASINIPDNVTSIENYAFNGCSGLTSITIGSGITSIEGQAFYNSTNASFTIKALTPPTITSGALPPPSSFTKTIYVPAASVDAYKAADGWISYASRIQPIP